jgi:superfamily II DNA or RNA helicase
MTRWYRVTFSHAPADFRKAIGVVPGVAFKGNGALVPENAAWAMQEVAKACGVNVRFSVIPTPPAPINNIVDLTGKGVRAWVPPFLTVYQREGIMEMVGRSGLLLWAAGCLSGDTEVVVNRASGSRRMKIRDLVYKFNGGASVMSNGRVQTWKPIKTYTQSFDEQAGVVRKNEIVAAVASGVKTTYTVTTVTGETIRATADHRFLTPAGWFRLSELSVGDELLVESWPTDSGKSSKPRYIEVPHMDNHPHAVRREWKRGDREHGVRRSFTVAEHRLVVEARRNLLSVEAFVGRIVMGKTEGLSFLPPEVVVHHIDENPLNNALSNLQTMDATAHYQHHAQEDGWKHVQAKAVPSKIMSIVEYGEEETFDLSMLSPHNNFVANGIVVHNSGKTLGGICWARANGGATVVVTRAAVRRSFGREIERFTDTRAYVIEPGESIDGDRMEEADFVVVGWQGLPSHLDTILEWKPKNVIFDEIHLAKSHKRFKAVPKEDGTLKFDSLDNIAHAAMTLSRAVQYRLGMTATPIKDRVRDMWAELDLVEPSAWGPFYRRDGTASFAARYCDARVNPFGGIDTGGSSNLEELWNRVSLSSHQVPHSVTHRDLPPRRRIVTFIPTADQSAPSGGFLKELQRVSKSGKTAILEVRLAEAASRKRAALVERIEECIDGGQKVLVFTGRRHDCTKLVEAVRKMAKDKATVYTGDGTTSAKERDGIQQAYMADAGPCILIGTGDAWGEGVNLQDTDTFLIAMLPFTPGQIVQWEGRVARHGQKRPVLIEYLVAENTVDEHVANVLLEKLPAVEQVAKDDSITGFADQLDGVGSEDALIDAVFAMMGDG